MEIKRESIRTVSNEELLPLIMEDYKTALKEKYPEYECYFDREVREACEQNGTWCIYTVRDDGKLVGYASFWIGPHSFMMKGGEPVLVASLEACFVSKKYPFNGLKLMRYASNSLKKGGIDMLTVDVSNGNKFGAICKRIGMKASDVLYELKF